jgi:manganese/zinc/iron transport system substrate-binding protein
MYSLKEKKLSVIPKVTFYILFGLGAFYPSASCAAPRPTIVTTIGMIGTLIEPLVGDNGSVVTLMGSGVDPHLFKPTRSAVKYLGIADVILVNGLHLEGRLGVALERVRESGKEVYPVSDGIEKSLLLSPPEFQGAFDPHVWMDPVMWRAAFLSAASHLMKTHKELINEEFLYARDRIDQDLLALHECAEAAVRTITPARRVLITAHDAFQYFGRRYGIEVRGIQGLSTESEAGLRDLEDLVTFVVHRKIPAAFVESTISPRTIRALQDGVLAHGHSLTVGGELFADAMGTPGTYEGTYLGMMDHNITTIVRSLGGTLDKRGCFGRLSPKKKEE